MIDTSEMELMSLLIPNGKIKMHTGSVIKSIRVDILLIQN